MRSFLSYMVIVFCCLVIVCEADAEKQSSRTSKHPKSRTPVSVQRLAPKANYGSYDFSLQSIDGKKLRLSNYAGKVVLVTIWSTSCDPCKIETRALRRLFTKYHKNGFDIVGVAVQTSETELRSSVVKDSLSWVNGINDSVASSYGMYGLPDHYLFNPDGNLIKHFIGFTREDVLEPFIENAVKAISPSVPARKKRVNH